MRIVTWNINGLGSLKFPFNLHAHHTHAYPSTQPAASALSSASTAASQPLPADDYDYDDHQQQLQRDDRAARPLSPSHTASGSNAEAVISPCDPSFPAFPSSRLLLTPRVVANYEQLLEYFDADILCLQEVKIARTKLDLLSKAAFVAGYDAFFSFSRRRPGYSGVVTYTRSRTACPVAAEEGVTGSLPPVQSTLSTASSTAAALPASPPSSQQSSIGHNTAVLSTHSANDLRELDSEGRCVITDHGSLLVFNVYVPNAGDERDEFKQRFLHLLQLRIRECQAAGRRVLLVGDLNIAAARIDHAFPEPFTLEDGTKVVFEQSPSRLWWKANVSTQDGQRRGEQREEEDDGRLVDAMRELHPHQRQAYTCWNTLTGARAGNHGARIDYVLTSAALLPAVLDCRLLSHVQGSDHCPVRCDLDAALLRDWQCAAAPPSHASQYWTEFSGQQRKLSAFFRTTSSSRERQQDSEEDVEAVEDAWEVGSSESQREGRRGGDALSGQKRRPVDASFKPAASRLSRKRRAMEKAEKAKQAGPSLFAYFTSSQQQPKPAAADASTASTPSSPSSSLDGSSVVEIDAPLSLTSSAAEPPPSSSPPAGLSPSSASSASAETFSRLFTQSSLSLRCPAHALPARLWTVNKKGANLGRKFFCCQLPPPGRCSFWKWHSDAVREHKEDERRRAAAAAAAGTIARSDSDAAGDAFITAGEHLAHQERLQQRPPPQRTS